MPAQTEIYLTAYRERLLQLSAHDAHTWLALKDALTIKLVKRGEYLLREGDVCRHIDFVAEGIFRIYRQEEDTDITTGFFTPTRFMTDMKSIATLTPSQHYIQALEDSIVMRIQKEDMIALYQTAPLAERIGRAILEHLVIAANEWQEMYAIYAPAGRYSFLMEKDPEILQKAPLKYVASFLGMRQETLSRIRKKAAQK